MKVGLVSLHSFLKPGGVKTHVFGLYKEFRRRCIETKIIVPRRKNNENYGKNVILLGTSFPFPFGGSQSDFSINFNSEAISETLSKEKFDVLHFHNFSFPSSFQILERSEALNILTFHSNIEGSGFLKNFPVFLDILKLVIDWKIDGIIGVAPLTLEIFKKYPGHKIIIPNGVDIEKFNPRIPKIKKFDDGKIKAFDELSLDPEQRRRVKAFDELSLDPEQRRRVNILFVGRVEKRKGLIYLLKAYKILEKKFKNLRLIVVGEGELKEKAESWVKANNLREVHFEGEKVGRELASYFATSDIFCAPSIFGESFGIIILEAMASGLPVVGFANRGYQEFLKGKKAEDFLVQSRDYKKLAEKLEILIREKKLRKEIGKWGIVEAKKYSWPKIASQVLDFYKFCQKNRKKRDSFNFEKIIDETVNKEII
jgi:phosphatidylinositol alpha-mannosyltransferase